MIIQPVSEPLLHFAGMTEQEMAPGVTQHSDRKGKWHNHDAIFKKNTCGGCFKGEGVDGLFDNLRNQHLQQIHTQEAD